MFTARDNTMYSLDLNYCEMRLWYLPFKQSVADVFGNWVKTKGPLFYSAVCLSTEKQFNDMITNSNSNKPW